jgi:predicted small lipoprotein YifL
LSGNFIAFRSRQDEAIFVWCRRFGDIAVNRSSSPLTPKWAVILVAAAVLALAGCGRKGPLDLPPTGTQPSATTAPADPDSETEQASKPSVFNPAYGSEAGPTASKGAKKSFILDPLLGN